MEDIWQGIKDAAVGIAACFFFCMTITWLCFWLSGITPKTL